MTDFMKELCKYDRNQIEQIIHSRTKNPRPIQIAYRLKRHDNEVKDKNESDK